MRLLACFVALACVAVAFAAHANAAPITPSILKGWWISENPDANNCKLQYVKFADDGLSLRSINICTDGSPPNVFDINLIWSVFGVFDERIQGNFTENFFLGTPTSQPPSNGTFFGCTVELSPDGQVFYAWGPFAPRSHPITYIRCLDEDFALPDGPYKATVSVKSPDAHSDAGAPATTTMYEAITISGPIASAALFGNAAETEYLGVFTTVQQWKQGSLAGRGTMKQVFSSGPGLPAGSTQYCVYEQAPLKTTMLYCCTPNACDAPPKSISASNVTVAIQPRIF